MSYKDQKKSTSEKVVSLPLINENAAGIDVGSRENWVKVPPDRDSDPIRCFPTFTDDLHILAQWLKKCKIETVALESTGIYWLNLFLLLQDYGFEVFLVNAQHAKNVSGRKSDVKDADWIQTLHSCGLLNNSFQPDNYTRKLRTYCRFRSDLIKQTSRYIQHMQKALEQMNIKLTNVISSITGKTGQRIIEEILKGERNPKKLAKFKDGRIKASEQTIEKSLRGNWREEYIFLLQKAYDSYHYMHEQIKECDQKIEEVLDTNSLKIEKNRKKKKKKVTRENTPKFDVRSYLKAHFGVDLTEIDGISELTALNILSEIGSDFSKWPTVKHFLAWLNVVPNNKKSGGKEFSSKIMKKKNVAGEIFRKAAATLWKDKGPLGDYYKSQRARKGGKGAIIATAAKLARIVYSMVNNKEEYSRKKIEREKKIYQKRRLKNLKKKTKELEKRLSEAA